MSFIGCRIKTSLRDAMLRWASDHGKDDLSFVVRRCLDIGWPIFIEDPYHGLEPKPKREYLA